ncbi:hypothetical protein [Luteolibacter sp. LG18]|uniref:hypothetical protein n=1 Tax=Luteolibacter sp. LG18 TaxID=2819286 RepID=UPI002B2AA7A0|nr:hypothetical protein llg_39360 [Luteolibacter sp. LG18]
MSTPNPEFCRIPRPLKIENLLAEVEDPRPLSLWRRGLPYFLGVAYGAIAWIDGTPFFMLFCGVLAVVFAFQDVAADRAKKRNAALVKLLREMVEIDDTPK